MDIAKRNQILEYVALVIIILSSFALLLLWRNPNISSEYSIAFFLGTAVLAAFLSSLIHELGHLVIGLLLKFKFEFFIAGPLGIIRKENKIKVVLNTNPILAGGCVGVLPIDYSSHNIKKLAKIVIAGPLFSLFFAIIFYSLSWFYNNQSAFILVTLAVLCLASFFSTTIPSKSGISFSDRKAWQRLRKKGKPQNEELAILKIKTQTAKEESYKNINPEDINTLINSDILQIKTFGLFYSLCKQIEEQGTTDSLIKQQFEELSKKTSKFIQLGYKTILTELQEKYNHAKS